MTRENGFSLIEILIVITLIGIIAAIAIPVTTNSQIAANESSAISSVRTLTTGEFTYLTTVGNFQYGALADLQGADIVDSRLGSGTKQGYNFVVVPNGSTMFTVNANPVLPGTSGRNYFYADATGVIRINAAGPAGPGDPALGN